MGITIKSFLIFIATVLTFQSYAGTEVPWPYSSQQPITEKNSKGIWWVGGEEGPILYNVEIFDNSKGTSWMRVTELDPWTYEIMTYGEGFYCNKEDSNEGRDGRYVYMFAHADQKLMPYPLHLTEVNMGWGVVLGISIYKKGEEANHVLGYRDSEEPLNCYYPNSSMDLVCDKPKATTIAE